MVPVVELPSTQPSIGIPQRESQSRTWDLITIGNPPLHAVPATFIAHGAPSMQIICCVYVK